MYVLGLSVAIVMTIYLDRANAQVRPDETGLYNPFIEGFNSPKRELLTPNYNKELVLFKGLSAENQHQYLEMSREEKLAMYRNDLV